MRAPTGRFTALGGLRHATVAQPLDDQGAVQMREDAAYVPLGRTHRVVGIIGMDDSKSAECDRRAHPRALRQVGLLGGENVGEAVQLGKIQRVGVPCRQVAMAFMEPGRSWAGSEPLAPSSRAIAVSVRRLLLDAAD